MFNQIALGKWSKIGREIHFVLPFCLTKLIIFMIVVQGPRPPQLESCPPPLSLTYLVCQIQHVQLSLPLSYTRLRDHSIYLEGVVKITTCYNGIFKT